MRRRLFTILTAMSVIVVIVAVALSVRMRFATDHVFYDWWDATSGQSHSYGLTSSFGSIWAHRFRTTIAPTNAIANSRRTERDGSFHWQVDPVPGGVSQYRLWPWITAGYGRHMINSGPRNLPSPQEHWWLSVRMWPIIPLAAIFPLWWTRSSLRERRRARHGLCPVCGYDLRESPLRCPECGGDSAKTEAFAPRE